MIQRKFLLLSILIFSINFLIANNSFIVNNNNSGTEICFELQDFKLENHKINSKNFSRIILENNELESFCPEGHPDLPSFSKLVALPSETEAEIEYKILEEEIIDNIKIIPSRNLTEVDKGNTSYIINENVYSRNSYINESVIEVIESGIMRGTNVSRIMIKPFDYNPVKNQLKVLKKIQINITYKTSDERVSSRIDKKKSRFYDQTFESTILNYNKHTRNNSPQRGSYVFIYNGNPVVLTRIDTLVQWKRRKGFEVDVLNIQDVGNSVNGMKQYLQTAYQTWDNPPEYICIVGDVDGTYGVPTFYEYYDGQVAGDYPLTLLDGDDHLPDAFVGRLSFGTTTDLTTIVNKTVYYETNNNDDNEWMNSTLLVGDPINSGESTTTVMMYVKNLIEDYNPESEINEVYETPFPMQINYHLNEGTGVFLYRGFGGSSGWTTQDVAGLSNEFQNPFVSCITCFTGTFQDWDLALTESLLRAGTPSTPTGAIGAIGSSSQTHTCFNNIITASIGYAIYKDGITTPGAALSRSKLALYENYPTNPHNYVDWWSICKNLMGDPGVDIWTKAATPLNVEYNETIALGSNHFSVLVKDSFNQPLSDVWVTLLHENESIFESVYTDENGYAFFSINADSEGTVMVTATKHNFQAHLGETEIQQASNNFEVENIDIIDPFLANETANFKVRLLNLGNSLINSASSVLSTNQEGVTVIDSISNFSTILPGQSTLSQSNFSVVLSSDFCFGDEILLNLAVNSSQTIYNIPLQVIISGYYIELEDYTLSNSIIPGQNTDLNISLKNIGDQDFQNSTALLSSRSQYVTIIDSVISIPEIEAGSSLVLNDNNFSFSITDDCIPGMDISFQLILEDTNNITHTIELAIPVGGASVTDPTGPDNYGYYCYDDEDVDTEHAPVYDWIEIDPDYSGNGTRLNMYDDHDNGSGDIKTVDLPFFFRFYGRPYNQISISSNGYILMGDQYTHEWMNWTIPGPFVPTPIIAPFWDDLLVLNGDVCTYYDETIHAFIVEWSRLNSRYNYHEETFQVLLYDPEYNPTHLGDSKIKIQYKEVSNMDSGNYGGFEVDHGEYSTVGIGDHTTFDGLEYTFSNQYPVTAKHLEDNMAILFTGPPNPEVDANLLVSSYTINDLNGNNNNIPDFGETIEISLSLKNIGQETAENVTANLSTTSSFISITQPESDYENIEYSESISNNQLFEIEIAENCPNNHVAEFTICLNYNGNEYFTEFSLNIKAPELEFIDMEFIDDNNYFGSGDIGLFEIKYRKMSYLDIDQADFSLTTDNEEITITPESITINDIQDEYITVTFNAEASENAQNGETVTFTLTSEYYDYLITDQVDYILGNIDLLFAENFDPTQNNWNLLPYQLGEENLAGGTGNELVLSIDFSSNGAITSAINCQGAIQLICKFKYFASEGGASYGLSYSQYSGFTIENIVWMQTSSSNGPDSVEIIFEPNDQINDQIFFTWFSFGEDFEQQVAFDDIEIYAIRQNPGKIDGIVTISGSDEDVTDVEISNGIETIHPDETGYYIFNDCPPAIYTIQASLDEHSTFINSEIEVFSNLTTTLDIEIDYLLPPSNLTYDVNENQVTLSWDFVSELRNSRDRDVEFDYFRVNFVFNDVLSHYYETENTSYVVNMFEGNYDFWITAVYEGENISAASDTVSLTHVPVSENPAIPIKFALSQNQPNPFSLSKNNRNGGTLINFSLPEKTNKCKFEVFNLKGEIVKELLNKPMNAGYHSVVWDCTNRMNKTVASGVYFYKLTTDTKSSVKKAIIIK